VDQAGELLKRKGRVSYRALTREFALDAEALEDLKEELIDTLEAAADKDGKMLVWTGGEPLGKSATHPAPDLAPPPVQPDPVTPAGERR
jgi:hypothetical protein